MTADPGELGGHFLIPDGMQYRVVRNMEFVVNGVASEMEVLTVGTIVEPAHSTDVADGIAFRRNSAILDKVGKKAVMVSWNGRVRVVTLGDDVVPHYSGGRPSRPIIQEE